MATIITHEGQPMTLNYATNLDGRSQSHTGTEVRIAAQGPQAANVLGITDQQVRDKRKVLIFSRREHSKAPDECRGFFIVPRCADRAAAHAASTAAFST